MTATHVALCAAVISSFAYAVMVADEGAIGAEGVSSIHNAKARQAYLRTLSTTRPAEAGRSTMLGSALANGLVLRALAEAAPPFTDDDRGFAQLASELKLVQAPELL